MPDPADTSYGDRGQGAGYSKTSTSTGTTSRSSGPSGPSGPNSGPSGTHNTSSGNGGIGQGGQGTGGSHPASGGAPGSVGGGSASIGGGGQGTGGSHPASGGAPGTVGGGSASIGGGGQAIGGGIAGISGGGYGSRDLGVAGVPGGPSRTGGQGAGQPFGGGFGGFGQQGQGIASLTTPIASISNYAVPTNVQAGRIAFGNTTPFNSLGNNNNLIDNRVDDWGPGSYADYNATPTTPNTTNIEKTFAKDQERVPQDPNWTDPWSRVEASIPIDPRVSLPQGSFPVENPARPLMSYDNVMTWPGGLTQLAGQASLATRIGVENEQIMQDIAGPPAPHYTSIPEPRNMSMGLPPETLVVGDPRVGLPTGSYPAAVAPSFVNDPRVGLPTGTYPVASAPSVVHDPRVGLPTGGYPAAAPAYAGDPRVGLPTGGFPAGPTVAGDPRVGMPVGSYPVAEPTIAPQTYNFSMPSMQYSGYGTYMGPSSAIGANSGMFADTTTTPNDPWDNIGEPPYVGNSSTFSYWNKGLDPLSGTATAGVLASQSVAPTVVAGDPRVGLPTGSFPAAPADIVAQNYSFTNPYMSASKIYDDRVFPSGSVTPTQMAGAIPTNQMPQVSDMLGENYYTPPTITAQNYGFQYTAPDVEHVLQVENVPPETPVFSYPGGNAYPGDLIDLPDPTAPTKQYIGPYSPEDDLRGYPYPVAQDRSKYIQPTSGPPPSNSNEGNAGVGDGGDGGSGDNNEQPWFNKYYNNPAYQTVVQTPMPQQVYTWDPATGTLQLVPYNPAVA